MGFRRMTNRAKCLDLLYYVGIAALLAGLIWPRLMSTEIVSVQDV